MTKKEKDEVSKKKKIQEKSVQELIPIKKFYKGMIITNDDRYIKIIEVLPINFTLRSQQEQDNIILLFSRCLRKVPLKIQFKVITRRADSFKIINNLIEATANEDSANCRELADNYIDFVRQVSGTEALTRRFFFILEYELPPAQKYSLDEIAMRFDDLAQRIKNSIVDCGNEIVTPENEDYFHADVLYQFYNRQSCTSEPFADRVMRIASDTMKMKGLQEGVDDYPEIDAVDYIAPRGVEFSHPDYFICDGCYESIIYIKKNGYPVNVLSGWMSSIIEAGDGIDVDIILHKENRSQIREKVALKLKLNRIKASGRSDVDTDYEEIENAIESANYIKGSLAAGEDFFNIYTFITISAESLELLKYRKENLIDGLHSIGIESEECTLRMEDAFQVVSPLLTYKKDLMQLAKRNIMTMGASSVYPFTSCEICDENGVVLGINRNSSSLVNIDIFNTRKYKNANIAILGTTGSGKTYTELLMALRMRIQGIQTFILTPEKGHEFKRACDHIDGSFIKISPSSRSCINIMEIRPVVNPVAEFLDGDSPEESGSWLYQKTTQLLTFFKLLIPDLKNEEEQLVDEAVIKTYSRFHITHDNQSIYNEDGTVKKMPIIGDLYNEIRLNSDLKRVANILGRFVTGSAQTFNQQTNVNLDNKFIVFDISELTDTLKAVGMFIVMDFLWTKIKANRTEKKALFIDEGWQLIGASADARVADFVYRIFKVIRGYGGSAIFATQDITDLFAFMDGKFGKAIISNSKTKIVLNLESQEAGAVKDVLQLTDNEVSNIINYHRGEGLICVNNNKIPVLIRASTLEDELITTDPKQLREIMQRQQSEQQIMKNLEEKKTSEQIEKDAEEAYRAAQQAENDTVVRMPNGEPCEGQSDLPIVPMEDPLDDVLDIESQLPEKKDTAEEIDNSEVEDIDLADAINIKEIDLKECDF